MSTKSFGRHPTAQAILTATREVIAVVGVDALTMDAVGRRAFVARSSIYVHFPGKQGLIRGLARQCAEDLARSVSLYADVEGDARTRVHRAVSVAAAVLVRDDDLLSQLPEAKGVDPEFLRDLSEERDSLSGRVADRIQADQRAHLIPLHVDARAAAHALSAMLWIVRPSRGARSLFGSRNRAGAIVADLIWRALYLPHPEALPPSPEIERLSQTSSISDETDEWSSPLAQAPPS